MKSTEEPPARARNTGEPHSGCRTFPDYVGLYALSPLRTETVCAFRTVLPRLGAEEKSVTTTDSANR
jgi:hypothetical protein